MKRTLRSIAFDELMTTEAVKRLISAVLFSRLFIGGAKQKRTSPVALFKFFHSSSSHLSLSRRQLKRTRHFQEDAYV
jgi:hypothetical protein